MIYIYIYHMNRSPNGPAVPGTLVLKKKWDENRDESLDITMILMFG